MNFHIRQRQQAGRFFRPFDQQDTGAIELVAKTCGLPFFFARQPVQIEVAQV